MRKNVLTEIKLPQKMKMGLGGIAQDIFRDALLRSPGGGLNGALLAVYASGISHGAVLTEERLQGHKIEGMNL